MTVGSVVLLLDDYSGWAQSEPTLRIKSRPILRFGPFCGGKFDVPRKYTGNLIISCAY